MKSLAQFPCKKYAKKRIGIFQLVGKSELKEMFNFRGVCELGCGFFELGIAEA